MSGAPDTDNRGKPDLSKPVKITGMNQAIALLDKRTNKALNSSKVWGGLAVAGAVVTAGMLVLSGAPIIAGAATLAAGGIATYEKIRAETTKEVRRDIRRNPQYFNDQRAGPDLSAPVKITGMNKALSMLDKKKNEAFKGAKKWTKVAAWAGGLVAATAFFNMTPVMTAGFLAVSAAVATTKYIKGHQYKSLMNEFNARAGHDTPQAPAQKAGMSQRRTQPSQKVPKADAGKNTAPKDDGKKPWKPIPGMYGQRK